MTLDATTLSDFRADIGDETSPYAFTDVEIERLFARASNVYHTAKLFALEQLLYNAAKLYKYVAGFTRQEQDQIFEHLKQLYEMELKKGGRQALQFGMELVPTKNKEEPDA
jgi:DNA-binding MltR family transcriptional regulator